MIVLISADRDYAWFGEVVDDDGEILQVLGPFHSPQAARRAARQWVDGQQLTQSFFGNGVDSGNSVVYS